jgi:hypothetical protein
MRALAVLADVVKLVLVSIPLSTMAGVSGDTETRFLLDDSRSGEAEASIEQWTSIYYKDIGGSQSMGIQFAAQAGEDDADGRLYQCYLRTGEGKEQGEFTLGRFETADNGGFYTLDGLSITQGMSQHSWRLIAGKPRHLEAYAQEDDEFLLGLNAYFDLTTIPKVVDFNKLMLNLGMQRRWSDSQQMLFHGGLYGERPELGRGPQLQDFQFFADINFDDLSLQRAVIDTHFDLRQQGAVRLGYHYYLPDEEQDTFRDRFHGIYNSERQSIFKGVWYLPPWYLPETGSLESRFEISRSSQKQGGDGLGLAAELTLPTGYGPVVDGRVDYLEYVDEWVASTYLRYRQPITSLSFFQAEGVYQTKQTQLSGKNHLQGLSLSFSSRLLKQLFLELDGEYLDHSVRDDEYRAAVSLRYEFYQVNQGELP